MKKRSSGILLPIFSLPSPYGIGGFSKEAYTWIDQLKEAKQSYWQILPLGPTGYGDSPYQSFSAFAGNPYFVDLESLAKEGLLNENELEEAKIGHYEGSIRYDFLYETRFKILRSAFQRQGMTQEILDFVKEEASWLEDYALFMAIKDELKGLSWLEWPKDLKMREKSALEAAKERLQEEIHFWQWVQYHFHCQWLALKSYANQEGIKIIGDMPIYVAMDSADTWQNPKMFWFDEDLKPIKVAGCPPDSFSADGQLWGNPLYRWDVQAKDGYHWWIRRIKHSYRLYDSVRIDHFRAFDEYYAISAEEKTAVNGNWEIGPGISLFDAIKEAFGELEIIAEDLGFLTPSVIQLRKMAGFPGMKILIFGFDSDMKNDYLPFRYSKDGVAYTGTHDNQTLASWYQDSPEYVKAKVKDYYNLWDREDLVCETMIRSVLQSVCHLAIIPLQDYLHLDDAARINEPSTLGNNWQWRLMPEQVSKADLGHIAYLTYISGRSEE